MVVSGRGMGWIKNNLVVFVCIILLLLFNEFTLGLVDTDHPLSPRMIAALRIFDVLLILGAIVGRFGFPRLLILPLISCALALLAIETFLRSSSSLHQLDRNDPTYVPFYLKQEDVRNEATGSRTEDGFRTWDINTTNLLEAFKTDPGCKVAVLGDSFVWGDALLATETWPAKLNRRIDCKVYPFGVNGWSSLEQFQYYEENLADVDFDFLLVGVVSNDPHPRGKFCGRDYDDDVYRRYHFSFLQPLGLIGRALRRSYALDYMDQVLDNTFTPRFASDGTMGSPPIVSWGYGNWELRLYEDDVMSVWQSTVKCFLENTQHPTAFLLTPTTVSDRQQLMFEKIVSVMEGLHANHINAYPGLLEMIGDDGRSRSDWASAGDAHPGHRQNVLYASLAQQLLEEAGVR